MFFHIAEESRRGGGGGRGKKRYRSSDAGGAYKKRLNDLTGLVTRGNRFYSEIDRPSDRSVDRSSFQPIEKLDEDGRMGSIFLT